MSATNQELVSYAYLKCNIIDETQAVPSAEQGVIGLNVLNDMLANLAADGVRLGWYPQTNLANTSPLQNQDIGPVKLLLTRSLSAHYGIQLSPILGMEIEAAETRLRKRALRYAEANLSDLPRPQGPWQQGWY